MTLIKEKINLLLGMLDNSQLNDDQLGELFFMLWLYSLDYYFYNPDVEQEYLVNKLNHTYKHVLISSRGNNLLLFVIIWCVSIWDYDIKVLDNEPFDRTTGSFKQLTNKLMVDFPDEPFFKIFTINEAIKKHECKSAKAILTNFLSILNEKNCIQLYKYFDDVYASLK